MTAALFSLVTGASAQTGSLPDAPDKPCGIGEILRDGNDAAQVLISLPGRFHWKYTGPLASGNVSIMIGEGFVYRFVQEGDKMSSTNIGKYLKLRDGEKVVLDQGAVSCVIVPSLRTSPAFLDIQLKMIFLSTPQEQSYRLVVTP